MCAPWLELACTLMRDTHPYPSQCFLLPALWRAEGSCLPWWILLSDGPLTWSICLSGYLYVSGFLHLFHSSHVSVSASLNEVLLCEATGAQ